ncbi:MAG: DUF2520 domain-containing protein, partial [Alphaproteobacteria bacterium]|nr:DUF2520 domain-containing protein [Alphaproteobacteria bacterium]
MKTDKTPSYLIIGNGRVAKHLHSYFDLMKVPFLSWNRRENSESQLLSMLEAMKEAASPIVLLPIKDSAIQEFFDKHISRFNYTAYHFSGASVIKNVLSAHPLMTFGHELYDSDFYKKIFFAVSSKSNFKKHFPFLPN